MRQVLWYQRKIEALLYEAGRLEEDKESALYNLYHKDPDYKPNSDKFPSPRDVNPIILRPSEDTVQEHPEIPNNELKIDHFVLPGRAPSPTAEEREQRRLEFLTKYNVRRIKINNDKDKSVEIAESKDEDVLVIETPMEWDNV